MAEVRPVPPEMFAAIYPLLQEFPGQKLSRELWRRMLFDPPWPVAEPQRGYALFEGEAVVGFYGTMFSHRTVNGKPVRFCNLSSWIVKESHRAQSLQILRPILALENTVLVNPSPNAPVLPIFRRFGFEVLDDTQWLVAPLAGPGGMLKAMGATLVTDPARIRERLDDAGRAIHDSLEGSVAAQVLLVRGGQSCHVVATRSPWKGRWRLAHVRYASDWEMFWEHAPLAAAGFLRTLGTVGLRVDGRNAAGRTPAFAVRRPIALPPLYRPGELDITPGQVDGLYAEGLFQPW
jgi:hypothetical protein